MKKLTVLLIMAGFAGGVISTKIADNINFSKLNPFKETTYSCDYNYYLHNNLPQSRSFDSTEKVLSAVKDGSTLGSFKVIHVSKQDDEYKLFSTFHYGDTMITCKEQK